MKCITHSRALGTGLEMVAARQICSPLSHMDSWIWKCGRQLEWAPHFLGAREGRLMTCSPGECQDSCVSLPGVGLTSFLHVFVFSLSHWLKPRHGEDRASTTQATTNGRWLVPPVMGEGIFLVLYPSVLMDLLVRTV